ncbi:MAG: glutamate-1-semialdehyde 2,1-aminomutase [Planctomycetota bacterium]
MPLDHTRSSAEFARARNLIPGGVNSPARAFGAVGRDPVIMDRGEGPYVWDIDGNRYIDFIGSWGPHILGHRHPAVMDAIATACAKGTSFGAPTLAESELAEAVVDAVDSVEMVRMTNSGTEAAMSAIRLARGATGRDVVVKFAGNYHGHVDAMLVSAGSGALTLGTPSSPGVPAGCTNDTVVLTYNEPGQLEELFAARGEEIAGVFLEGVVGNMGLVPPEPEFLAAIRRLTEKHGAVMGVDEVMTGFRLAYGGAQEVLGITPDVSMFGKVIGGGMPVGAYGGRRDIMEHVSPVGPVYQAGTLSGNPVAMASGLATLRTLKETNPYPRLEELGARLARGFDEVATKHGVPHAVQRVGSMLTLFFNPGPVRNLDDATASDTDAFARFFRGMLDRGVYLPCSQFEAMFASAAHDEAMIDETIAAADAALADMASDRT